MAKVSPINEYLPSGVHNIAVISMAVADSRGGGGGKVSLIKSFLF